MTEWSKRRRLEAAIGGEKPDRPPVALWRHWPGDDQDPHALAAAHLKWQQDYDWDLLKIGPSSTYSVEDWGVQTRWVGHIEGTREYTRRTIHQPDDWASLSPLEPNAPNLAAQIESLRMVGEAVGETVPFIATIFSPLSQAKHLAGDPLMLSHMRRDPDAFHQGLATITESTLRFIEAAKGAGIAGIFLAVQHARYPLMSRVEFMEFGRPYDLQVLTAVSDLWCNMVHLHGAEVMFDLVADYPAQFLNWHDRETGITLGQGLAQIQGAASGGVDQWSLHQDAPSSALAEAEDALNQTDGRRLLLGTGCVIMVTTPTQNIRALRELASSYKP
ncbi:MAG: uroporphyrinogen decarboxylase [Chloroflexi bacterium]|nr:uroporphyrinogen decarboxylase [Chloroflexota bacterium]